MEAEKAFDSIKRKYANAIAFLLVKNVPRTNLHAYFEDNEENRRRFQTIKKLRADIIASRPKAKIWVDKPFYVKLDLGKQVDAETHEVSVILGECVFKQKTCAVTTRPELEAYMETIAKIIDAEKVWADPEMADFDTGERDFLGTNKKEEAKNEEATQPI